MFDYLDYIRGNRLMYAAENINGIYALKIDKVVEFLQYKAPQIQHPFSIVTHWGDFSVTQQLFNYAKQFPFFRKWFGQNVDCSIDSAIHSLPIGLEDYPNNLLCSKNGSRIPTTELLHESTKIDIVPSYLVYANFTVGNYPKERELAYKVVNGVKWALSKPHYFQPNKIVTECHTKVYNNYLNEIKSSYYVMCPRGAGIDTHRFWETLYLGRIPIVKRCNNTRYYEDLPVLIVDTWEEVTEKLLTEKLDYYTNRNNFNMNKLKMSWWITLFKENLP